MHLLRGQSATWLYALCASAAEGVRWFSWQSNLTGRIKLNGYVFARCTRRWGCQPAMSEQIQFLSNWMEWRASGGKLLHLFEYSTQSCGATPPQRPRRAACGTMRVDYVFAMMFNLRPNYVATTTAQKWRWLVIKLAVVLWKATVYSG